MNFVESLLHGRSFELVESARHRYRGYFLLQFPQIVSPHGLAQGCREKIGYQAKSCAPGEPDVTGPVARKRICIVHDEWLPGYEARLKNQALAVAGSQHVQADAHMRVEESLAIKSALPGALYPDENYRFHRRA
jgi:hypothetical protein